jgi:hypothetical protein
LGCCGVIGSPRVLRLSLPQEAAPNFAQDHASGKLKKFAGCALEG